MQIYNQNGNYQNDGTASPINIPPGAVLETEKTRSGATLPARQAARSTPLINGTGVFKVRTANQWIAESKTRPAPKQLFGPLWYEGELCILFADTNTGKSIKAVQIGDAISRGGTVVGLANEAGARGVLYCDFELSDKQFEIRYSNGLGSHYQFSDNFHRAEIDPDADLPAGVSFEDYVAQSIAAALNQTGAKVLIIDNLTYLRNDTEKAKDALPLMKAMKALKARHGLSILVLAHTPKRDLSKPLSRNDLMGSKMLINFCDSAFAIGESQKDKSLRYLKQIKARNTEVVYDSENVLVCQITKPDNFLKFDFIEFGNERDHLRAPSAEAQEELKDRVKAEYDLNPAKSAYEIAQHLEKDFAGGRDFNSFKVTVTRIVARLKKEVGNSNS